MILILEPNTHPESTDYRILVGQLERLPGIQYRVHQEVGTEETLTEIYLIGDTGTLSIEDMQSLPCVERVVRVSEEYRILGRHKDDDRPTSFEYNGVRFGQDTLQRLRRAVRRGHARARRDDDEGAARQRPGLHAHGRLQAAHQPLRLPGPRQDLPAVRVRAGRQVRHQGDRDGDHPRIARRRDPRGAAADRQPDRRDAADRHAQHAELRAAEDRRPAAASSRCCSSAASASRWTSR